MPILRKDTPAKMKEIKMSIYNDSANPRAQAMFASIKKYLSSELTQKKFCQNEKLAYSTFQKWLQIYKKNNTETVQKPSPKTFIPVEVTPHRTVTENSQCIIEYPNGIIIHFKGEFDSQLIQSLIQNR